MNQVFWVGVFPGLTDAHKDYLLEIFHQFVRESMTRQELSVVS